MHSYYYTICEKDARPKKDMARLSMYNYRGSDLRYGDGPATRSGEGPFSDKSHDPNSQELDSQVALN